MRNDVKARVAPPYEGRQAWYGLYLDGGLWRLVRNADDRPIIYTSEQYAINAAVCVLDGEKKMTDLPTGMT